MREARRGVLLARLAQHQARQQLARQPSAQQVGASAAPAAAPEALKPSTSLPLLSNLAKLEREQESWAAEWAPMVVRRDA